MNLEANIFTAFLQSELHLSAPTDVGICRPVPHFCRELTSVEEAHGSRIICDVLSEGEVCGD